MVYPSTDDEDAQGADGGAEESKKRKRKRRKGGNNSNETADVSASAEEIPYVRPDRVAAKPSKSVTPVVPVTEEAAGSKKDKEKKKKKSKNSGSKEKEKSEVEKRLSLYR